MTNAEWCKLMEVPDRTLNSWVNKNEEFKKSLREAEEEYRKNSKDALASKMRQIALESLYKEMVDSDGETKRKYLTTILQETRDLEDNTGAVLYANFSDTELAMMAMGLDIDVPGYDREALKIVLELQEEERCGRSS